MKDAKLKITVAIVAVLATGFPWLWTDPFDDNRPPKETPAPSLGTGSYPTDSQIERRREIALQMCIDALYLRRMETAEIECADAGYPLHR